MLSRWEQNSLNRVHISACLCVHPCVFVCMGMCMSVSVCMSLCECICMCASVCTCVCICMQCLCVPVGEGDMYESGIGALCLQVGTGPSWQF